ncbi:tRNA pseudouridine(38-40) synthase TruA [Aliiroseovarius sp. YM-037]|uniref:tRNA pseudouridine(38-40) synthase TruA n=1 Tax=Aliiroseovarius sp. YM-037 TaxID=3341728 RepID=UPI003A7F7227
MPRYALKIEYDGAPFAGWQRQRNQATVQQAVETALAAIDPDGPVVTGAGRTDSGVHATAQVAHCDTSKPWDTFRLVEALNFHLKPAPVAILQAAEVDDDFSARFSAVERSYLYRIVCRRAPLTVERGLMWRVNQMLDVDAMQEAADHLIGKHDFTTFRSVMCQAKSPVKTLDELRVETLDIPYGKEVHLHVRARSFLHNQVRSFAGSLERVGAGAWRPDDMKSALESCDRASCGPVAPPQGLYLTNVRYDPDPFAKP